MVDAHLRSKTIETADIKNLIIGGQTGIDGIRFCLAAVTNGENLADPAFSWFLQYKNKNGQGESVGLTPVYENGLVKLPWVPNKLATQVPGRMQIQLYAAIVTGEGEAAVVDKQWVSESAVIYIQENINPDPIVATEPSIIEYYVTLYAAYKNAAEAAAAAALVSEQAAGTSEDNAADHAAAALASKNAAGISETNAAGHAAASLASKNAAGISETNAAGHEAAALASKNAAGISETNAAGHEVAALASKNAAGVSEGNASDSKLKAQKWAEEGKDVEVEPGKFSAKHWMEKASGVYDNFDARFLGYKDADPALDNKGNALVQGALYFNSVSKMLRLYNGTAWGDLANSAGGITYSGAGSGLEGTNVQAAIDELNEKKAAKESVEVLQLATARQETRANELEKTLNSTQGTTFDTTDIGTVVLPPNAAGRALVGLKGLTARNLVINGDFSAGTTGWGAVNTTLSASNNELTATGNTTTDYAGFSKQGLTLLAGHTYALLCEIMTPSVGLGGLYYYLNSTVQAIISPTVQNQWYQMIKIYTPPANSTLDFRGYNMIGKAFKVRKVRAMDLTGTSLVALTDAQFAQMFNAYFFGTKSINFPARIRSLGKNLTDIRSNAALKAKSGVSLVTEEGRTCWKVNNFSVEDVIVGIFKPNTRYTLSMHGKQTAGNGRFEFLYTDGTSSYSQNFATSFGLVVQITTAGKTLQAIRCAWGSAGTWWVDVDTFMLHEGAVALPYEPHQASSLYIADATELRSVPAVHDKVAIVDDELVKVQNVNEVTFVGTEQWFLRSIADNTTHLAFMVDVANFTNADSPSVLESAQFGSYKVWC